MKENHFEEFFKTTERYFEQLSGDISARNQFPNFQTITTSTFIAAKTKAEFSVMAMYYRNIAIPQAQEMVESLHRGYEGSLVQQSYSDFDKTGIFQDAFYGVVREAIMGGYISISHKIENLVDFINSHSKGVAYGVMDEPNYGTVDYIPVLKSDFGLDFSKLVETEFAKDREHLRRVVTPRIHRIRVTANRIKHQGGYPKSKEDFVMAYYPDFDKYPKDPHRNRIPFSVREFLLDLEYAERYIDHVLTLIEALHIYAIASHMAKQPVKPGQEESHYQVVRYTVDYKKYVKGLVDYLRIRQLDNKLEIKDRLPHPATFLKQFQ